MQVTQYGAYMFFHYVVASSLDAEAAVKCKIDIKDPANR